MVYLLSVTFMPAYFTNVPFASEYTSIMPLSYK